MTPPYYSVSVSSTRWAAPLTSVQGAVPTGLERVLLGQPFRFSWAFDDDLIPSPDITFSGSVVIVARTAKELPEVRVGDLIQLDVRVGTAGARIIKPPPMRVTTAEVELVDHKYPARLTVGLTDLSVDWRGRQLVGQAGTSVAMRRAWRERFAEYGYLLGLSVGAPTDWAGTERPPHPFDSTLQATVLKDYNHVPGYPAAAGEQFAQTLNSHQPLGQTHTAVTIDWGTTAHPAGYGYVGPSSWSTYVGMGPITEPATTEKIELVPAGRKAYASAGQVGLPWQFAVVSGKLTIQPRTPPLGRGTVKLGVDAGWCVFPAKARRSREAAITQVLMEGPEGRTAADGTSAEDVAGKVWAYTSLDASVVGISTRKPPFDLYLGTEYTHIANPYGFPWPGPLAAAPYFVMDSAALLAGWTYDEFELHASRVPDSVAAWLLPLIAPRLPGETDGDGRLVRHLTIARLDKDIRFQDAPLSGFVTGGQLSIVDGELVFKLRTIPGEPTVSGAVAQTTTPVTVQDIATGFPTVLTGAVDPAIIVGELPYIDY